MDRELILSMAEAFKVDLDDKDMDIVHRLRVKNGCTLLESMLHTWVNCAKQTRCSGRFPPNRVHSGAPFYYGTTTVPDGVGGYITTRIYDYLYKFLNEIGCSTKYLAHKVKK
ncbi:hypothetical protein AC249_AIPGENE18639 [Exaiptasia diaphana]|nr:hypothetical protein AC249_AIPGENE18639 [Exaiptasia diaphana]